MSFLGADAAGIAGVGVYTLEQAATLVRLRVATVDAIVGPKPTATTPASNYPIAAAEVDLGYGEKIVTFLGLMELRVATQLYVAGVPWSGIRYAAREASEILKTAHPLTSGKFHTDSRRRVFLSIRNKTGKMPRAAMDLLNRQQVFEDVIEQSLTPAIVVRDSSGRILKWFPIGKSFSVVLDPERRFGEPMDPETGIPTASLAEAYHAERGNLTEAAGWFGTSRKAIRDAVAFAALPDPLGPFPPMPRAFVGDMGVPPSQAVQLPGGPGDLEPIWSPRELRGRLVRSDTDDGRHGRMHRRAGRCGLRGTAKRRRHVVAGLSPGRDGARDAGRRRSAAIHRPSLAG